MTVAARCRKWIGSNAFTRDQRGTVAVLFTFSLMPMVILAGVAIDYGRAHSVKSDLQSVVDAAAIAGASYNEIADSNGNGGRINSALEVLNANSDSLHAKHGLRKNITVSGDEITVTATAPVKTTFTSLIMPIIPVRATAVAKFGRSGPLCLLALNKTAPDTFKVWGTADLIAPDCAVQSHSVSNTGMASGGSATATAAHFCSAGGHGGSAFSPEVEDNCRPSDDPYAGKFDYGNLTADGVNVAVSCTYNSKIRVRNAKTYEASSQNSVVAFCGGLTVKAGATVTFGPGVYKFYDELRIESGASVVANGATFYFADASHMAGTKDGYMTVIGGGNLDLKAPTTGPLAGIAMVQPTVPTYTGSATPALTHTIIGGGTVNIHGTIYTPQAKVRVTGNGTINNVSTYFSIIADMVELEGNGQLYIKAGADAFVSGLPNMALAGGYGGKLVE